MGKNGENGRLAGTRLLYLRGGVNLLEVALYISTVSEERACLTSYERDAGSCVLWRTDEPSIHESRKRREKRKICLKSLGSWIYEVKNFKRLFSFFKIHLFYCTLLFQNVITFSTTFDIMFVIMHIHPEGYNDTGIGQSTYLR